MTVVRGKHLVRNRRLSADIRAALLSSEILNKPTFGTAPPMNVVKNFLQQQMVGQRLLGELPIVRRTSNTAFHSCCRSDVSVLLGIAPLLCCKRLQFADSHIADRAAIDTSAVRISAHRRLPQSGVHPYI